MKKPLIILNSSEEHYDVAGYKYTWNSYVENHQTLSILKYVEHHADEFKEKYLRFIHDIGEYELNGNKIREHFKIDNELSLWWMSLIAEKSPWKSPKIIDCIKVMAIEKIVKDISPNKLILVVDDKNLARLLKDFCKKLEIEFLWAPDKRKSLKNFLYYDSFLNFYNRVFGFMYLCYYFISRWRLKEKVGDIQLNEDSIFFSSYFYNLDNIRIKHGEYYARQWGELPNYVNSIGHRTLHLENYIKSPDINKISHAKELIKVFNAQNMLKNHIFLDQYLSFKNYFKVLKNYLKLIIKSINYRAIKQAFDVNNSKINLWHLMKDDWFSSFCGKTAISNLIWINLFDDHLKNMPHQKLGFYLCENMGWERSLIHTWKKYGHGILIAVPHSTIRYWDLRYFQDKRINLSPDKFSQPVPSYYALNGKMAWDSFIDNNYLETKLLKSEALRYQFLSEYIKKDSRSIKIHKKNKAQKKVLILGDFTDSQTQYMLREIQIVNAEFNFQASYTLKPHPVSKIDENDYPRLNLSITRNPLENIVSDFDIVFASNTTSACLDCFLMGMKVIIFMDGNNLNFSPLRNIDNVSFVNNASELYRELTLENIPLKKSKVDNFFWIDRNIPKWKKIVDIFV